MGAADLRDLPDELLIERFRVTRSHETFSEIFRRYRKPIYISCLAVLRSPPAAEEMTQETFTKLFSSVDTLHGGSLGAWLHRVARNLCLNLIAARRRSEDVLQQDDSSDGSEVKSPERDFLLAEQVRSILKELPSHQRIPIKLFFLGGYSYKEIAALLGYSEEQVKSYLQNGKRQFRIRWEDLKSSPKASE